MRLDSVASVGGTRSRGLELEEGGLAPSRSKTALGPVVLTTPPSNACPSAAPRAAGDSKPMLVLQDAHTQKILGAVLSHDGRVLATGGLDGIVRVWDTNSGVLLRRVPTGNGTFGLSLSAGGDVLATYAPNGESLSIEITTLGSDAPPRSITPTGSVFALSPDGKSIAIGILGATLRDATTGSPARRFSQRRTGRAGDAFDASGKRLVVALGGKPTRSARARRARRPVAQARASLSDPRRERAHEHAAAGRDPGRHRARAGAARIDADHRSQGRHETASAAGEFQRRGDRPRACLGRGESSGRVLSFDLATAQPVGAAAPLPPHPAPDLVAVSGDGATLVSVASDQVTGQSIRVEDAATRRALRTIEGLPAMLTSIAIDPRGDRIVTGSLNGAVTRWDAHAGNARGRVARRSPGHMRSMSFDDAGATLAVAHHSRGSSI